MSKSPYNINCLVGDFGCGKTLLLKYFANKLAKRELQIGQKKEIHFLSLASAKGQELQEMNGQSQCLIKSYRQPSVIDVANIIDFKGTDVKVILVEFDVQYE